MKSYPGSSAPPLAARPRSGCSKRTPVSSTATTVLLLPKVWSQAASMLMADCAVASGARRYHWPTTGPPVSPLTAGPLRNKASLVLASSRIRPLGSAYSTSGSVASWSARAAALMPLARTT